MSVLSARSRACTDAALAFLASGLDRPWPTGSIEDATGYGPRYGQLLYRMLDRLYRLGRLGREGGRGTQWFSVHWRWWPDEGNCDTAPSTLIRARCGPADCMRPRRLPGLPVLVGAEPRQAAMTSGFEPAPVQATVLRLGGLAACCVAAVLVQRALARKANRQEDHRR